jgi:hypothetical protein
MRTIDPPSRISGRALCTVKIALHGDADDGSNACSA